MNNDRSSNPHVKVMSNDWDAMQRIHEIGMLPERQRIAALREWQAEQEAAKAAAMEVAS